MAYSRNTETVYRSVSGREGVEETLFAMDFSACNGEAMYRSPNMGWQLTAPAAILVDFYLEAHPFTEADAAPTVEKYVKRGGYLSKDGERLSKAEIIEVVKGLAGAVVTTNDYPTVPRN